MTEKEIMGKINSESGAWFNADGNYYKMKKLNNMIHVRAFRKAKNENGDRWIQKEFYKLDPKLLQISVDGSFVTTQYENFHEEPIYSGDKAYHEFEAEADYEYEGNIKAIPAKTTDMFCSMNFGESSVSQELIDILEGRVEESEIENLIMTAQEAIAENDE